jgi:predicted transcriptional regulator
VQSERDMLNQRLKETIESTMTAEERAFAMEQLLKEEEARIHQVEKELARLREIQVCLNSGKLAISMINLKLLCSHAHELRVLFN